MAYVAGFLTPVPNDNRDAYVESARKTWNLFREYGAIEIMEAWGDEILDGTQTDFNRAVALKDGETVCLGWTVWPDKAAYDACGVSMETDPRWRGLDTPFDGKRMMWGGFAPAFAAMA